jgi:hypothetical protein
MGMYVCMSYGVGGNHNQTFIKPTDLQINLEAKSKLGGQNGLILNKDQIFIKLSLLWCMTVCTLDYIE